MFTQLSIRNIFARISRIRVWSTVTYIVTVVTKEVSLRFFCRQTKNDTD